MKEAPKRILRGATLLATVLVMTGYAHADSRLAPRDSKFKRHTVQDAVDRTPHTVQDHFEIPDHHLPPRAREWEREGDLRRFAGRSAGARQGGDDAPYLALTPWLEPIVAIGAGGPGFDPASLPAARLSELSLRAGLDDPGRDSLVRIAGAQVPGPGALPLLGLGTLALFGRRRRP